MSDNRILFKVDDAIELADRLRELTGKTDKFPASELASRYNAYYGKVKEDLFSTHTGKIYSVKIPKFASNQTTTCIKMDDNANLSASPSTDSFLGQDDYINIPLFRWYDCNYVRDANGHASPTAIKGFDSWYTTSGDVDVGVIQMTPYVKWDESNSEYTILSISDTAHDGFTPWPTAVSNGEVYPYVIHSKYTSGLVNGLPRSQPDLVPDTASYESIMNLYPKKGTGYRGAGAERNSWQIIFMLIKYATKSSQAYFTGCASYSYQYAAAAERTELDTYFPLTAAQAATIVVGSRVSIGYSTNTSDAPARGSTANSYASSAKVLKIENNNVYLNCEPFSTAKVNEKAIYLTTMPWASGSTDVLPTMRDGSLYSNTNSKMPYRIQGIEYLNGQYICASDVAMVVNASQEYEMFVYAPGTARSTSAATIRTAATSIGTIPVTKACYIGDITLDVVTGVTYPSAAGSGSATGYGDYYYRETSLTNGTCREWLMCGNLWDGSSDGASRLHLSNGLGGRGWGCAAAD